MSVKMFRRDNNGRVESEIFPPEQSNSCVATGWVFDPSEFPDFKPKVIEKIHEKIIVVNPDAVGLAVEVKGVEEKELDKPEEIKIEKKEAVKTKKSRKKRPKKVKDDIKD